MIIFSIFHLLPGDPVIAYLMSKPFTSPDPDPLEILRHKFGLDQPLIVQYFRFLEDLFTGNWGESISVMRGTKVIDVLKNRTPLTIDLLILPIMLGIGNYIVFGIMLGRTSNKYKGRRKTKVIQILCCFSMAIPIFFFGMVLPATGYKDPSYRDPEFVTGFYIIDALLAGETKKIFDYLYHLAFPLFIITLTSTALITWQTRSYLKDESHKKSIISNTAITGTTFGSIFIIVILIETTFGLDGIGRLFIDAINKLDYWLITGVLLEILIMFVIITLISNLLFSLYKFLVNKFRFDSTLNDKVKKETENNEISSEKIITENLSIKEYLLNRVKSPLFIIAAILVIFFISIAIFPQWLTPYSFEELTGYNIGSWDPPSSDHPLGTASFGRDVLGLTIWGIRDALIFGFGAVVIALIGGSIFGFINWISPFIRSHVKHSVALVIYDSLIYSAIIGLVLSLFTFLIFGFTAILIGLIGGPIFGFVVGMLSFNISSVKRSDKPINFHRLVHSITFGSMIIFSIFPGVILLIISISIHGSDYWLVMSIHGSDYWLVMSIIGILLIPIFTQAISSVISREFAINKVVKTIITYIPLCFTIAIILYEVTGYLGWAPSETREIHLGFNILVARFRLDTRPLASFSPGIAITCIIMSFLLLHIALQENGSDIRK